MPCVPVGFMKCKSNRCFVVTVVISPDAAWTGEIRRVDVNADHRQIVSDAGQQKPGDIATGQIIRPFGTAADHGSDTVNEKRLE